MAKAKKLPSGQWRTLVYDYTDETGKRHYGSFTADSKKESEFLAAEYALNKKIRIKSKITYGKALDSYIEKRETVLSVTTIREYRRERKNYPMLENIPITDITQDDIQMHINYFSLNHSPKSVRNNHGLISAVLKEFRPDFALNTVLPSKKRPVLYVPTEKEIKKVLNEVKGTEMEVPILLAAFGPMRRGEICALRSDCIEGNRVHVCRNMVLDKKREWQIKQPKSYAGDRFIDYPDFVAKKLKGVEGNITDLNPNMITSRFEHILIHAGVPHFRFHDLRHYCASILHALNIPDAYIMERGGWGNEGTLKNVYRHTLRDKKTGMTNKANNYFNKMNPD